MVEFVGTFKGKSGQFALLLERAKTVAVGLKEVSSRQEQQQDPVGRDRAQLILSNFEVHFTVEQMLEDRLALEKVIMGTGAIDSLDDAELVGHYLSGLHQTNELSKAEVARLTGELEKHHQNAEFAADKAGVKDNAVQIDEISLLYEKSRLLNDKLIMELKDLRKAQKDAIFTQNTDLNNLLESTKDDLKKALLKQADLEAELKEAKCKVRVLQEELQRSEGIQDERIAECRYLQEQLHKIKQSVAEAQESVKVQLGEEIQAKDVRIRELEDLVTSFEEEKSNLQENIHKLEQQLELNNRELERKAKESENKIKELQAFRDKFGNVDVEGKMMELADLHQKYFALLEKKKELERETESSKRTMNVAKEELLKTRDLLQQLRKEAISVEYIRNVLLSFLTIPTQRRMLLEVLSKIFNFSPQERSSIIIP